MLNHVLLFHCGEPIWSSQSYSILIHQLWLWITPQVSLDSILAILQLRHAFISWFYNCLCINSQAQSSQRKGRKGIITPNFLLVSYRVKTLYFYNEYNLCISPKPLFLGKCCQDTWDIRAYFKFKYLFIGLVTLILYFLGLLCLQ